LKYILTQFVLVLSLLCNPLAAVAMSVSDVPDTNIPVVEQTPCHSTSPPSQPSNIDTGDDDGCQFGCCVAGGVCSMDESCQNCSSQHRAGSMLMEIDKVCYPHPLFSYPETVKSFLLDRFIPPEIHPPAASSIS